MQAKCQRDTNEGTDCSTVLLGTGGKQDRERQH